jgi:hypothetical protein
MSRRLLLVATLALSVHLVQCVRVDVTAPPSGTSSCPACAVSPPATHSPVCKESRLSREEITQNLDSGSYVLISAGRNKEDPEDARLTDDDIQKRHEALQAEICKLEARFSLTEGHYEDQAEQSFFVLTPRPEQQTMLILLGAIYRQHSVIVGNKNHQAMVSTIGATLGRANVGEGWHPVSETTTNHTSIQPAAGGPLGFCLDFDFNKAVPYPKYLDWMRASKTSPTVEAAPKGAKPCNQP